MKNSPWPESTSELYRLPLVGEVSANSCGYSVPSRQRDESLQPYFLFSRSKLLLFFSSSSSILFTRLSGPLSRLTTSQEMW
jgi:hypothetical protein